MSGISNQTAEIDGNKGVSKDQCRESISALGVSSPVKLLPTPTTVYDGIWLTAFATARTLPYLDSASEKAESQLQQEHSTSVETGCKRNQRTHEWNTTTNNNPARNRIVDMGRNLHKIGQITHKDRQKTDQ
mmetsp:Transcript_16079/g.44481  ORF Transcript_16079/g.44481 Transcript_16079/m.44481 type:complete len:131 (+) Transcript_16079:253-645(+)